MDIYSIIITIITSFCGALFLYQGVYLVIALVKKLPEYKATKFCRYAVIISAKNEENVIGHLVKSILAQDYPKDLFEVFVIADNCTDNTADVAKKAGATVLTRFDEKFKGKGYALKYFFNTLEKERGLDAFDGYMIFDADNLLEKNYITEINKVFTNGYRICTSYRNSKNYGDNWLTSATGLWFLREARHLNHTRMLLGISCMVSGTGYVVHKDIIKRNGGWKFFKLTEDVEFSVDSILKGETIGYCESAVFYDEQPTHFADSFNQRLRWAKGFYQVLYKNFFALVKRMFTAKTFRERFTCFDSLVILSPGQVFLGACVAVALLTAFKVGFDPTLFTNEILTLVIPLLISSYILFCLLGASVLITEYKKIFCSTKRVFLLVLAFPIFMITYIPIAIIALFAKVKWKPIRHVVSVAHEDLKK
jgi:cellulose synthase/poly-beta-1,6-N-acetylglucosamine synthase-like glycosyltransferase